MSISTKTAYSVSGPVDCHAGHNATYELSSTTEDGIAKDVDVNQLRAWLRGPSDVSANIVRLGLGSYQVTARPVQPGSYHLDVTISNRAIFTATDMVTEVRGHGQGQGTAKICFELEGLGIHAGRVGEPSQFTIKVTTGTGSPMEIDLSRLNVTCAGPQNIRANVSRHNMGHYQANFLPHTSGEYSLYVAYDGNDVLSQRVYVSDNTRGANSTLTSIPPPRTRPNTSVRFAIQSKDGSGRHVAIGGDDWQVTALGPLKVDHLTVTDNRNGTYAGEIIFPGPGDYTIDVTCQGHHAQGSPFKVLVEY